MTDREKDAVVPTRRDRMRPLELVGLAGAIGVFVGLVVGLSTREWILAAVFFGAVFIVSLVVLAMLSLAATSSDETGPDPDDDGPVGH
ncbi:MAG TPA: ABC transporter ATP-binding protein [Pseudolysinimonas sp.]|nr:ABC transporter ATP-binding protein [Pseudolysinimonas sp.]